MKLNVAVRLLQMLPVRPDEAMTIVEISSRWKEDGHGFGDVRNLQRYLKELTPATNESGEQAEQDEPSLVKVIPENPKRFYLNASSAANWLMSEEAALNILLTRQVLGRTFGSVKGIETSKLIDLAEKVAESSTETQRIRQRLRVIPDGIGRLQARIPHNVLQSTVDAVAKNRKLNFSYIDSKGEASTQLVSPQGLVAKDGTIYLLATKGLSDMPSRAFAMHRMIDAEVNHHPAQARPDFDIDRYIQESHQLSHKLDVEAPPVELRLRVAPETLYHFKECPLSSDQSIAPTRRSDGWHLVTANVPNTVLLVPFLLSMGGWIEVIGPKIVRDEISKRLREMTAHYASEG